MEKVLDKKTGQRVYIPGGQVLFTVLVMMMVSACHPGGKSGHSLMYYNAGSSFVSEKNGVRLAHGQPMTGILYRTTSGGDTLLVMPYQIGKQHGMQYAYYHNGQMKSRGTYVNGWKQGKFESWYPGGSRRYVYNFKDDVYHGEYREWYPSGKVYKKMNYTNGHEDGRQQVFFEDGRLRANYEVKGNRIYGNIGTVGCSSIKN